MYRTGPGSQAVSRPEQGGCRRCNVLRYWYTRAKSITGVFLKSRDYLAWIDCEMTGLQPEGNWIIEIATVITDNDLNIVAEGPVIAVHQDLAVLKAMDNWNRTHHRASGLWDRVLESRVSMAEAEAETLQFVRKYCYKGASPLCGNSIGQDRKFLDKDMPTLHGWFHYQSIDVSTIKQLTARWYGDAKKAPPKKERHLALSDIKESIEELRFYRKQVFKQVRS